MNRLITAIFAGLALFAFSLPAAVAEDVIVLDAPDVQKLRSDVAGFRTSEVIGTDVYSNGGELIGELQDFMVVRGGYLYAVVDTTTGTLNDVLDFTNEEMVVVPWNQLRMSPLAEISAAPTE